MVWYAPAFALVTPSVGDNIDNAAFSLIFAKTSPAVGPGGTVQAGLTATVHLTIKEIMPAETTAALTGSPLTPRPLPLQSLSCALEIPYRQAGSQNTLRQRFPGTVAQKGDQLTITVSLLDDWVRLAYSALAYPPATGSAPRIIIDYGVMSYSYIRIGFLGGHIAGTSDLVGGGLVSHIAAVNTASDLPSHIASPILVRDDLTVVGPAISLRYQREGLDAPSALANQALPSGAVTMVRPELNSAVSDVVGADGAAKLDPAAARTDRSFAIPRLVTRSLFREETVDALLPCASYGNFYLQQADNASSVAIGCQDSLRLGDTALHAFDEISALRDPAYRVYRSLQ
jgi:hypothetical protein